jgi:hypothetical protein
MESFKFLNNEIDQKLVKVVYDNIFTIVFCAKQMELGSLIIRHLYRINDFSNIERVFKIMVISGFDKNKYGTERVYHYIIYDGTNHISLKFEKNIHNDEDIKIISCKLATEKDITTFINIELG